MDLAFSRASQRATPHPARCAVEDGAPGSVGSRAGLLKIKLICWAGEEDEIGVGIADDKGFGAPDFGAEGLGEGDGGGFVGEEELFDLRCGYLEAGQRPKGRC